MHRLISRCLFSYPCRGSRQGGEGLDGSKTRGSPATLAIGLVALTLTLALVAYSESAYHAALSGLRLFLDVVLPSLLPFFLLSEVLLAEGVVHFLGVLLEPLMRPVFRVPGVGSFVFSMGLAAGYPMDAVLTARLRRERLCTRIEGERLLAFTNTADPLFLFGAVAVGMFHAPALGAALAFGHYTGGLIVGLLFRFHGIRAEAAEEGSLPGRVWAAGPRSSLIGRAVEAAIVAREKDGRSLVQVLNDAISESARTLVTIASFLILFAVLLRVLTQSGAIEVLTIPVEQILRGFGLPTVLTHASVQGLFEIDLGSAAAAVAPAPLAARLMVAGAIIAWSGLSVHAQVFSVLAGTDVRIGPYYVARLLHAVFAGAFTGLALSPFATHLLAASLPAAALPVAAFGGGWGTPHTFFTCLAYAAVAGVLTAMGLFMASVGVIGMRGLSKCRIWLAWLR